MYAITDTHRCAADTGCGRVKAGYTLYNLLPIPSPRFTKIMPHEANLKGFNLYAIRRPLHYMALMNLKETRQ